MNIFQNEFIAILFLIWSVIWKGIGLWRAAKSGQKYWFIAMLVLNTLGLIELIYLFKFAKHPLTIHELISWFKTKKTHPNT